MRDRIRKAIARSLQGNAGGRLILEPAVGVAYRAYLRSDSTTSLGYSAMRKLFGTPRGGDRLDRLARRTLGEHPPVPLDPTGGVVDDDVETVVEALRADGLCILGTRLADDLCDQLEHLARRAECTRVEPLAPGPATERFDPDRPTAVRYDLAETDLIESPVVQRLIADHSILDIAQRYLGCAPIQDMVAMWWTAASDTSSSAAAQQFHFDLDRLRFLKLFVYLTDVDLDHGPHVFVRRSHRDLPHDLRRDRRFGDPEVFRSYSPDLAETLIGPRGTMFLADTRGLHKGLPVREGHRLVFQIEFTSSLFGAPLTRPTVRNVTEPLRDAHTRFPSIYRRLVLAD